MVENLKRISYVVMLVFFCVGFVAVMALAFTPEIVIGEGRFNALIHQVELFDFKWWITGFALGLWLFPILLLITYQRARRAGHEVHNLQGVLRRVLVDQTIPVIVDIDQKIPVQLDEALDVPVELHTEVDVDSEVALEAEVPIRTELPVETEVQTKVPGIGSISIPIRARLPVDVVVPIKGRTRIKATGVPIDLTEIAVARLPAIEIPVRARIEARIDLLSNFKSAESFLTRPNRGLLHELKNVLVRLWRAVFK